MADLESIRFANEDIRPIADRIAQLYYLAKAVLDAWGARNLDPTFAKSADVLDDGSSSDGRPKITGDDVHAVVAVIAAFVEDCEAGEKARLRSVLRVAVNPKPRS